MAMTTTPRERMITRLRAALEGAYQVADLKGLPLVLRPILKTLQPRLAASLDREPERAVAILVWLWARLPEVIGDAVDLDDRDRVAAIVRLVEQRELGHEPPPATRPSTDPSSFRPGTLEPATSPSEPTNEPS